MMVIGMPHTSYIHQVNSRDYDVAGQ